MCGDHQCTSRRHSFPLQCCCWLYQVLWLPSSLESSGLCSSVFQPGFYKGPAGSQVTLSSLGNQTRALLDDQARHLLTEQERATMMYYLDQYRGGAISVEALVMALFELLNTHAKVTCFFCPYPVTKVLSSKLTDFWSQGHKVVIITEYSSQAGTRVRGQPEKPAKVKVCLWVRNWQKEEVTKSSVI